MHRILRAENPLREATRFLFILKQNKLMYTMIPNMYCSIVIMEIDAYIYVDGYVWFAVNAFTSSACHLAVSCWVDVDGLLNLSPRNNIFFLRQGDV